MKVAPLLLASIAILLAGACGGSGEKSLTLEEYFQQVQPLVDELHTGEAPILATLGASQDPQHLKEALADYPAVVDPYLSGLRNLQPPEEAAEAHADAVRAGEEFTSAIATAIQDTQTATTADDFFAAANSVQIAIASEGMSVTCGRLQQVADDNEIDIDLDCPES